MRRLVGIALLLLFLCPAPTDAGVRLDDRLSFTRPDGSAVPIARTVRVACRPWEPGVATRTLHIRAGTAEGPFWALRAVVADVRRRPVVRFPNAFVWDRPKGADLFALDGANELSSGVEQASGRITFQRVRCGSRPAVRFRVRAVLGSEFFDGEPMTVRGSFRLTS
jgi:hypothetical protein